LSVVYDFIVKLLFKFSLFILCFLGVAKFCKKQTDGFALARTSFELPFNAAWETRDAPVDLKQKFRYLGKGAQSYVFASEDGKYVLKLFRTRYFRPHRQKVKLSKEFNSYKIAHDELHEETGLVFLHLNKTHHLQQKITLVDKVGIAHTLDADQTKFLVQKRAKLLYPGLQELAEMGKIEEAKSALSSLVDLLVSRCQKGIFDKDPDLNTNFGLIGSRPIQIDIGRFKKDPSQVDVKVYKNEIIRITDNLHQWLMARYPDLDEHLRRKLNEI
jgi:hypothetical protein